MKNKNGKKLSILAVAGLTCLIPGLIVGCGNKNSDTDLFFTKGIKVTCGESLATLSVDGAKLKDDSGNYYLFLRNEAGEAVDLSETGSHEVVNPTIAPKKGTEDYFLRVKIQYIGVTENQLREIEDVEEYFTAVPTFTNEWLLCDDGYYYNVKDGVVEWNVENKSSQLKVGSNNSQQISLFGSNSRSYAVSDTANISYDYIGARVIVEAVNSKDATDSSLANQGWTFQTDKVTGLKLIYDMNGGSESVFSNVENLREGNKVTISSTVPTRTGYEFVEWNTSSSGDGRRYVPGDKVKMGQTNITLYAKWKANTYNVALNANGGSFESTDVLTEYTYGKAVNFPTPVKEGYTFAGWYDAEDNKLDYITETTEGNLNLTAKWSLKKYNITLFTNGGTIQSGNVSEYSIEQGATLPTDVKKEGYTFDGWYESYTPATGSNPEIWAGKKTEVASTEKGNKTFFAKWTIKSYVINLNLQDGILNGENISGQTKEYGSSLPFNLKKDGYDFAGWSTSAEGGTIYDRVGDFGDVTEVTLYAQWVAQKLSIYFNSNGGTIDGSTDEVVKRVDFNSAIGEMPVPARAGYEFKGWFDNKYFEGDALTEDTIWIEFTSKRVYAKWEALQTPYTVEYYLEGLDGVYEKYLIENKESATDSAVSVELKSFAGFIHAENDNDILQGTVAADGSLVLKIYYARKSFSISYELDGGAFASEAGKSTYRYGEVYELPAVSKHGYSFLGWYKNASFEGETVTGTTSTDLGDITFYAKFDQVLFNVKLNMLGGALKEGETEVTEHTYGYETKLPILEREGCEFGGWFDNENYNGNTIESISADVKSDTEYFAKWIGLEMPVSFETNGGTIQSNWIASYTALQVTELPIVTKPGYKFLGWYDNAEFGGKCYEAITEDVMGEKVFYAKWGDGEITFSAQGPDGVSLNSVTLPAGYTNTEHTETYTIPSLGDIMFNGKKLAVKYVKVNDSGARNKVGSTFTIYGDTKVTFVYDYVTELEIAELVHNGETIIEATTLRQWGESASLKFILPESQRYEYSYDKISWSDGKTVLYGATSYTMSTYGIKVTLTPSYLEGQSFADVNYSYKIKKKDGVYDFNDISYSVRLLRVTEGEDRFYAPDCRIKESYNKDKYRFLGWLKEFNGELSELNNLIQPGEIITFDINNDRLIGFWEYNTHTVTLDFDGGTVLNAVTKEEIPTEIIVGDEDWSGSFSISDNNRIGGSKIIDGEKYIIGGFEILSPLNYEELGYEIRLDEGGIQISRSDDNNSNISFGHDFKIKVIWTKDYMNQKIKINRKAGEHVYLDGKEVSELSYDGTIWSDEFLFNMEGGSVDYMFRLSFKKDGENCVGRLILTTKDGINAGVIEEGSREAALYYAFPGGLIGEIEWTKKYTAKIEKGSIPGVEITGEDVYVDYREDEPREIFNLAEGIDTRNNQGLRGFYYAEGYYCYGFKGYSIDTNEEVTIDNVSNYIGNVYLVPVWKKIEGTFNPGSIEANGETINAVMNRSFMSPSLMDENNYDGYAFGPMQLIDCLEIPGYPNYRIAGLNINGKDYLNLKQMGMVNWTEFKYLLKSDENGDTYLYISKEGSRYDPELGEEIENLIGRYEVIKDAETVEEGELDFEYINCPSASYRSYFIIKKKDGTILAYRGNNNNRVCTGLRPNTNSQITIDESSKIVFSTSIDESDPYCTRYKGQNRENYTEYYDLGDGYRFARVVKENSSIKECLMWQEGENIEISDAEYSGYSDVKVLYKWVDGEEKFFKFFKYNNEFYSVGDFSEYEMDEKTKLSGEATIFEQNITVLWSADAVNELEDKEEFESAQEEEEALNTIHQEIQNLRNDTEKYSGRYIKMSMEDLSTGDVESQNVTIKDAYKENNEFAVLMCSPKEAHILGAFFSGNGEASENKFTKSTEITVEGVSYSWKIVGDEVKLTNEKTMISSVDKVLEINGKKYTADFSILGLELKAEDGSTISGHAYFSMVLYYYGYDLLISRYDLSRENGEDYVNKINVKGFMESQELSNTYEVLKGPMPEEGI